MPTLNQDMERLYKNYTNIKHPNDAVRQPSASYEIRIYKIKWFHAPKLYRIES